MAAVGGCANHDGALGVIVVQRFPLASAISVNAESVVESVAVIPAPPPVEAIVTFSSVTVTLEAIKTFPAALSVASCRAWLVCPVIRSAPNELSVASASVVASVAAIIKSAADDAVNVASVCDSEPAISNWPADDAVTAPSVVL